MSLTPVYIENDGYITSFENLFAADGQFGKINIIYEDNFFIGYATVNL